LTRVGISPNLGGALWREMNWLDFVIKKSKIKATTRPNVV